MRSSGIDQRIFVVGVPRSGTTLVQSLLATHSRTTSFPETHFFSRHYRTLPASSRAVLIADPSPRLREFLEEAGADTALADSLTEGVRRCVPRRALLPLGSRRVGRELVGVLDALARSRERSIWIEKTPRHLRYVPFLDRLMRPESPLRFVHVIRNGLEVVASLTTASRNWEVPYDPETCVRRWNEEMEISLRRAAAASDLIVCYERLTSKPERTLERLFAALELSWEPEVLARFGDDLDRLVTRDEPWKADIGRELRPSATSERALTPEQREQVRGSLRLDLYDSLLELSV